MGRNYKKTKKRVFFRRKLTFSRKAKTQKETLLYFLRIFQKETHDHFGSSLLLLVPYATAGAHIEMSSFMADQWRPRI
jgi:hypothetical protein